MSAVACLQSCTVEQAVVYQCAESLKHAPVPKVVSCLQIEHFKVAWFVTHFYMVLGNDVVKDVLMDCTDGKVLRSVAKWKSIAGESCTLQNTVTASGCFESTSREDTYTVQVCTKDLQDRLSPSACSRFPACSKHGITDKDSSLVRHTYWCFSHAAMRCGPW